MNEDTLLVRIPLKADDYKRTFDSSVQEWRNDVLMNKFFLKVQQNYYNQLLMARGFVFFNEVLTGLGFPHTAIGAVTGWLYNENTKAYVDFGIDYESSMLNAEMPLVFNGQDVIVDKI